MESIKEVETQNLIYRIGHIRICRGVEVVKDYSVQIKKRGNIMPMSFGLEH